MYYWGYIIIAVIIVLTAYVAIGLYFAYQVNHTYFSLRGEDPHHPCYLRMEDFPNLKRDDFVCQYDKDHQIRGYLYSSLNILEKKGFVILSHGMFGSHIQYLIDINILVEGGYLVLAYDQYGVSLSDGETQVSILQGTRTLDCVLKEAEEKKLNGDLPLYLYGHSWGAYAVMGVLSHHKEINKAICRSGFVSVNSFSNSLLKLSHPKWALFVKPIFSFFNYLYLGRKECPKCTKGIRKNEKTQVLIIYSKNDPFVSAGNSQAGYFLSHHQENVKMYIYPHGLHNTLITEDSYQKFVSATNQYLMIQKINDEKEKARSEKTFYASLNRAEWLEYDKDCVEDILKFFND